ncbi:MAG: ATP-binding cassette domain-containing protein [Betaproteobacteria bacterium]
MGQSGAGKSTAQNIMTGLVRLQKGEVLYDGKSVRRLGSDFFNKIGVSFEHPNVSCPASRTWRTTRGSSTCRPRTQ